MSRTAYEHFINGSDPEEGWLHPDAIEQIISDTENATKHGLRGSIDRGLLVRELQFLASERVQQAWSSTPLSAKKFRELQAAFDGIIAYQTLALQYTQRPNHPSLLPREWLERERNWIEETAKIYESRKKGGRFPKWHDDAFFSKALGLFYAAFEDDPKVWVNQTRKGADGDAGSAPIIFLHALLTQIKEAVRDRVILPPEHKPSEKYETAWNVLTAVSTQVALRDKLLKLIAQPSPHCGNGTPLHQYEAHSNFFTSKFRFQEG